MKNLFVGYKVNRIGKKSENSAYLFGIPYTPKNACYSLILDCRKDVPEIKVGVLGSDKRILEGLLKHLIIGLEQTFIIDGVRCLETSILDHYNIRRITLNIVIKRTEPGFMDQLIKTLSYFRGVCFILFRKKKCSFGKKELLELATLITAPKGVIGLLKTALLSIYGKKILIEKIPKRIKLDKLFTRTNYAVIANIFTLPVGEVPGVETIASQYALKYSPKDNGNLVIGKAIGEKERIPISINTSDLTTNMLVIGHIGSGKTTFVRNLICELLKKTNVKVLVFDIKGEYYEYLISIDNNTLRYVPGSDENPLVINIFDPHIDDESTHAMKLYNIFSEIFQLTRSELSPQMERLLKHALFKTVHEGRSFSTLLRNIENEAFSLSDRIPTIWSSVEALRNRLSKIFEGPLKSIFGIESNIDIDNIDEKNIVIELGKLLKIGGKEALYLLTLILLKYVFDKALTRENTQKLRHLVVIEEAQLISPEILSKKRSSETTVLEDIVMIERAKGEGCIFISPRPIISQNILANTGIKVVFRSPYDAEIIGHFINGSREVINKIKILPRGEAFFFSFKHNNPILMEILRNPRKLLNEKDSNTPLHNNKLKSILKVLGFNGKDENKFVYKSHNREIEVILDEEKSTIIERKEKDNNNLKIIIENEKLEKIIRRLTKIS